MPYQPATNLTPLNDANRLGLLYRHEAANLPWKEPIIDGHIHIANVTAARELFAVADLFGVTKVWSQTQLEEVEAIQREFPGRVEFVTVPNYMARDKPETFTTDWFDRMEKMRELGARSIKFWAAPRGRDFFEHPELDHPLRLAAMRHARSLGYELFVAHVADPDTWFATMYKDSFRYGTKAAHHERLRRVLEEFSDVNWMVAHMGGDPEHLDHLHELLSTYPHLHLDSSATKWMVRELSKQPEQTAAFLREHPGRIVFGSDIVAAPGDMNLSAEARFDLYASRYWALRTMWETDYDGPSSIVDPDLSLVDPTLPKLSTAMLRGMSVDAGTLGVFYQSAAEGLLPGR